MEKHTNNLNDKKYVSKAKSCNNGPKTRNEPNKRKAFSLNEAVLSLDMELGRLKRSKLVGESGAGAGAGGPGAGVAFLEAASPGPPAGAAPGNASLLSMNFSHYELMRNLSRCTSNSEGAFSGATCNTYRVDSSHRAEHLEKYFRSVETWRRKHPPNGDGGCSCSRYALTDQ